MNQNKESFNYLYISFQIKLQNINKEKMTHNWIGKNI